MCVNNLSAGSEMIHVLHLTCPIIRRLKLSSNRKYVNKKMNEKPRQKGTVSDEERRNVKAKYFSICMQIPYGIVMLLVRMTLTSRYSNLHPKSVKQPNKHETEQRYINPK